MKISCGCLFSISARLIFISVYTTVSTTLQIINLLLFLATVKKFYEHNKLTKNVLTDECMRNYNKKEKERYVNFIG